PDHAEVELTDDGATARVTVRVTLEVGSVLSLPVELTETAAVPMEPGPGESLSHPSGAERCLDATRVLRHRISHRLVGVPEPSALVPHPCRRHDGRGPPRPGPCRHRRRPRRTRRRGQGRPRHPHGLWAGPYH